MRQLAMKERFYNLACDIFPGHLTTVSICRASSVYEGFTQQRPDIPLDLTWLMPDGYNQRILRLETQRNWRQRVNPAGVEPDNHFLVGILPENRWPTQGPEWDRFVGQLGECTGQYIQWIATLSGTSNDIRLGKILVTTKVQLPGSEALANGTTFSIQREDVPLTSPLTVVSI